MITTYKPKAYDAAQDINGLKDQLGSVLKEISAFGSRLEETKALQLHAEEYGFARSFSYEERLRDLKLKLQPGREPAKPVIFLTRMVVESLSRGPMSEKDIKTIVLDRCKELGIKSSNRGLIAGTGMDVATVCSVLAALGAIEATAPPDPKAADSAGNAIDTTSGPISSGYASASSATDTITGVGSGVYSVLTDRWQNRLSEYIQDALQSKAAMLLEADAMTSSGVGSGKGSAGSGGGIGKVFSNNTSANTSAGVTPSASSNNIASMVSPVSNMTIGTSANTTSANNTTNTMHNTSNYANNTAPINASINNTNPMNTSTIPANNNAANNAANTTTMSNTARLIAEYHSRNGTDPSTATNPTTITSTNTTINNNTNTTNASTANTTLPPYNTSAKCKTIQSYYSPLNGISLVSSGGNVSSTGMNSTIGSVNNTIGGGIGSVGHTLANNVVQGNAVNTNTSINTLPNTSIGYRAPLSTDTLDTSGMNTTSSVANTSNVNGTLKSPVPYALPTYTGSVPQYNISTLPSTTLNTQPTTQNTLLQPNTFPNTLPLPHTNANTLHPNTTYTTSNPATTPATVGFLSVTHPTNKLVLPNMSAEGTLSHSGSMNNVGAMGSGIGSSGISSSGMVGGVVGGSGMVGVNSSGMSNGMVGMSNTGSIGMNNSINTVGTVGGMNNMQYNVPMVHNTMPIVPTMMNTYPTNTTHPTFVTNTTNTYNNIPYNPNAYVNNTTYNTLPNNAMNSNTNTTNNTNNTSTTNTKAKAPKPPKPPAEKKLSKKAAAAAAKLLETNNANIGMSSVSNVGSSGMVGGVSNISSVGGSASSSVTGVVNANKARRGPSALRVWKLREEYVLIDVSNSSGDVKPATHNTTTVTSNTSTSTTVNAAQSLLLDPAQLHTAATTHYTLSSTLELEERIMRRIAGMCNVPLQSTRYRAGTSTISSDTDNTSSTKVSRVYSTFKYTPVVEEVVEVEPSYAVYDDTTTITATYLLDKIRRSKRQRGDCLYGNIHLPYTSTSSTVNSARSAAVASVGVYSAPHVHALSAVVSKTNEFYWNNTKVTKAKKAAPTKSANEPITMAQYARNIHTGTGGNSIVLSSCSNGSSITNHTLKRYAQPLELTNAHLPLCDMSNRNVFAAATTTNTSTNNTTTNTTNNGSVVLSIPDLTLNTREIAWTEIASEFAILPAPTEEGAIGFGYSASTAALDSVISVVPVKTEKKRKYLNNHEKLKTGKGSTSSGGGTSSGGSVSAASLAMEVLAPQFVEIVPVTALVEQMKAQQQLPSHTSPPSNQDTQHHHQQHDQQQEQGQDDDEDTSDEAFAARHEATLQSMRDKWTRLQQLKNDALYGVGNGPEVKQYRGGGYGGYFNRTGGNTSGTSASGGAGGGGGTGAGGGNGELTLGSPGFDSTNKFANLSPRKRGLASAHAKRRGRPPKNAKFHNNLHNNASASASAVSVSNSVSNTDGENMEVDD